MAAALPEVTQALLAVVAVVAAPMYGKVVSHWPIVLWSLAVVAVVAGIL